MLKKPVFPTRPLCPQRPQRAKPQTHPTAPRQRVLLGLGVLPHLRAGIVGAPSPAEEAGTATVPATSATAGGV